MEKKQDGFPLVERMSCLCTSTHASTRPFFPPFPHLPPAPNLLLTNASDGDNAAAARELRVATAELERAKRAEAARYAGMFAQPASKQAVPELVEQGQQDHNRSSSSNNT